MALLRRITTLMVMAAALLSFGVHAQNPQPEYQIGNGDIIRVVVFQNPDLTVETRVTENGTISYPLVGTLTIGGMTIPAAAQAIAKALSDGGFIQKPQVNIILVQNRGNQVSVLGAVGRPGRFPLETVDTRLSEMLAVAGGISATGADVVVLTGRREGAPIRMEIDVPSLFINTKSRNDPVVAGGDVLYVHRMPVFFVNGEAQKPGSYRIERDMTFRQALAQGGATQRGIERLLRVYRRGTDGKVESLSPDLNALVQPDDVLYIEAANFFIYGEVQKPGMSRIEFGMTVRQALAQSGGPTARGTERRLRLYRRGVGGKVEMLTPDLDDPVRPEDVLYVNESLF